MSDYQISPVYPGDTRTLADVKALLQQEGIRLIPMWITLASCTMKSTMLSPRAAALAIPCAAWLLAMTIRVKAS